MILRRWMGPLAVGLALAACDKPAPPTADPEPEEQAWIELRGDWNGVSGGAVDETDESLRLSWGEALTAARWGGEVPTFPFEFEAEARRIDGTDFFFSLTFPGRNPDEAATLVVGGWGGGVVGISSIDGLDASENETSLVRPFETGRWYAIRLVAEADRIRVWIDGEELINVAIDGRTLSLRPGPIEECLPFGIGTWQTTGEVRAMRWRPLPEAL